METWVPPPPFACRGRGFSRSLGGGRTKEDGCRHPSSFTHRDFAGFRFRDSAKSVLRDFSLPLLLFALQLHFRSVRVYSLIRPAMPFRFRSSHIPAFPFAAPFSANLFPLSLVLPEVPTVICYRLQFCAIVSYEH